MKKIAGLIIAFTLVGASFVVPAQANSTDSTAPISDVNTTPTEPEEITQLIVKYEKNVSPTQADGEPTGSDVVDGALVDSEPMAAKYRVVTLDQPVTLNEAEKLSAELTADPRIKIAEPDLKAYPTDNQSGSNGISLPSDQYFTLGYQWSLNTSYGIDAPKAWSYVDATSPEIVVGVIDSGIAKNTDLDPNVLQDGSTGHAYGYDFYGNGSSTDTNPTDEGGEASDSYSPWHGTHVSGIIAAKNNGSGIVGVDPLVSIEPIRVLGPLGGDLSDVIKAIYWGAGETLIDVPPNSKPAKILNLSLGGDGSCTSLLQDAINYAVAKEISVVVAAGNENTEIANTWPANCNNVITVGASANNGTRACFSNFDSKSGITHSNFVKTSAPGYNIYSTIDNSKFEYRSGTSMAAPHVAGTIALMLAYKPTLTETNIRNLISDSSLMTKFSASNCYGDPPVSTSKKTCDVDIYCGPGLLNAGKILFYLSEDPTTAVDDAKSSSWNTEQVFDPTFNDYLKSPATFKPDSVRICASEILAESCVSSTVGNSKGTFTVISNNKVKFTPSPTFAGNSTAINYIFRDNSNNAYLAKLTATVGKPDAPIGIADSLSNDWDTTQTYKPLENDNSVNNSYFPLLNSTLRMCAPTSAITDCVYTRIYFPSQGTYEVDLSNGNVVFDPYSTFSGTATPVYYLATDALGRSAQSTIMPIIGTRPVVTKTNRKFSGAAFASAARVSAPAKSTIKLTVIGSKVSCKIKSGKLSILKKGTCVVAVKVTPRVKVKKKYRNGTPVTTNVPVVVQ